MSKKIVQDLIAEYLAKGGNQKFVDKLPKGYSLSVEARLRGELRKLKGATVPNTIPIVPNENKSVDNEDSNGIGTAGLNNKESEFSDLISDYPVALHRSYFARKHCFLKACSLKVQLNAVPPEQQKEAFEMQVKIWELFAYMDKMTEKLDYWLEHKRILEDKPQEDFSNLSPSELLQRRNTLRSNASNRSRTILKMEEQLRTVSQSKKLKLQDKLLKKKEELRAIQLQIEVLDEMLKT